MEEKELGIYIHIPFCIRKCYYCDFTSYTNQFSKVDKYIKKVIEEIHEYKLNNYNITTIYIGGGTPSSIDSKYIVKVLNEIKSKISNNKTKWENIEITIELNPGTVTKNKLLDYKKIGINRLSVGLQSTNDEILKTIGRIHNYEDFLNTYKLINDVGFENYNFDLMIGLPEQRIQDIKKDLNEVLKLKPNHLSVYSLIIEEDTEIKDFIDDEEWTLPDEETERQMYWYVKNFLELNGYKHYEISNFAKEGKESKHNINCWKQKEYIGIGLSACSFLNNERYGNENDINEYLARKRKNTNGEIKQN